MTEVVEITHDLGPKLGQWELFQPESSGRGPMRQGTCPGCKQQTEGYRGACAAIRYRDEFGDVQVRSGVTTSYGHFECVRDLFVKLMTDEIATHHIPNTVESLTVHFGRQRDMIDFIQAHPGQIVRCNHNPKAPRAMRYYWSLEMTEK